MSIYLIINCIISNNLFEFSSLFNFINLLEKQKFINLNNFISMSFII
jgi:hypothetical protein